MKGDFMTPTQFREVVESIAMSGFLAARKLPGVTEAMAYDVKEAVRAEAIVCLCDHLEKAES